MRVLSILARLVLAASVLLVVSLQLLRVGSLPISPHALPAGAGAFEARFYGVIWWIALPTAVSALTSLCFIAIARVRGANGHRALKFTSDLLGAMYYVIAGIALASFVFEFPFSTLFATSSIIAVILGFALQNTVADLLGGLALSIEQPFRIGDRIDLGERAIGRVTEMNWRATRLLSSSGDVSIVPNSALSRARIINHDLAETTPHRSFVLVRLRNDEAPTHALDVLRAAAMSANGVLASPAPRIEIAAYGEWAIEYKILFYFKDWGEESLIASNVYQNVWTHLSWSDLVHERTLPALLRRIRIFESLEDQECDELARQLRPRAIDLGTLIIEQGASGSSLFVIREGIFAVRVRDADGHEREVAQLHPGDYIGEASLLTGAPRSATIEARTPGAVYEIEKVHLEPLLRARPEMTDLLAVALASRAAERDTVAVTSGGNGRTSLAQLAGQIQAFFRRGE